MNVNYVCDWVWILKKNIICLMSRSSRSRQLGKGNWELNMTVRQAGAVTRSTGSQHPNKASRTGPVTVARFS